MTTTTTMFSTLSLWLFLAVAVANLGFSYATTGQWANQTAHKTRCIPTERKALLEFKKHLVDPLNRLATWDAAAAGDDDCCSWHGVSCDNLLGDSTTQHVTGLHLRSLSQDEFYDSDIYGYLDDYIFGGKVSSALLNLKHLRYLDLSYNDFGGISIPSFLGSMRSLRYLNLSGAGFGGMLPHQLGNLSNLQYLNLEINSDYTYANAYVENSQWMSGLSSLNFLDLSGWDFSKVLNWNKVMLTSLPSLLQLHLSSCQLPSPQPQFSNNNNMNASSISILDLPYNYISSIPRELQNMSSLREVYLGYNYLNSSIPNWLHGLHPTLKVLSLPYNGLSSFRTQISVKNFSSLSILDLSGNLFQGPIPNEIQNMTSLQKLDLSNNEFSSSIPDWLYGLTRLKHLNLGYNNLEGKILSTNWNMSSLIFLDMSGQLGNKLEFEGLIPKSFKNLRVLSLGGFKLRQDINQVLKILSLPSNGLEELSLGFCQLFGNLGTTNQHFDQLMSLKVLDIGFNNFSGTFPDKLGKFEKLRRLYLDGNKLAGDISEAHFENLKHLHYFIASGNQFNLTVSPNWIPPFYQLDALHLESWHIGPQFPTWLRSLKKIESLDLSNSGISSTIPVWFWNLSTNLIFLNLSHNQIYGVLPSTLSHFIFQTIDMSSNHFHGPLPLVSSKLAALDLSNNSFSSSISKFLCPLNFNSSNMQQQETNGLLHLNLGQNLLHGKITSCLSAWPELKIINLSNNKLKGTISKSIGTLHWLESLHLRNNSLSGELPLSLNKCTRLITIDVGENELMGNISSFSNAQSLPGMKVLILHSNKFSGPIPEKLCDGKSLIILDLANNVFDGTIPSCLGNLSAMVKKNESTKLIQSWPMWVYRPLIEYSRFETALLRTKGNMQEYSTNLRYFRSLDFSNNRLCGKIPDEITRLYALVSLNLSHNALNGGIPKNIGSMQKLESMDLSTNQLSGEIPQSISKLTFLSKLNLSHNRLSGRIPSGNQIQTLDASGFAGNQLCGSPLLNNCSNDAVPNDANNKGGEDDDGMMWFYVSMAFGFVGGFWCFIGPLLQNRRWRFAYSQFLDRTWDKIWWKLHRVGMF